MGKCAKRAFQNGGAVSKADQLIAEMNAKYGLGGNAPASAPVVQQPEPQPQPKPQPLPQQQGITSGIIGILKGRQQQIDKAAGYANGGIIRGPGTAKSDSIPATVRETGEEIRVGNGERIVSKEQDAALGHIAQMLGYESVDAMFEKLTGKPVGPTIKDGKRSARYGANGEWINDELPKETNLSPLAGQTQVIAPLISNQGRGVMKTPLEASIDKSFSAFRAGVPQGSSISINEPTTTGQKPAVNPLTSVAPRFDQTPSPGSLNARIAEANNGYDMSRPGDKVDIPAFAVAPTSQPGVSRVTEPGKNPLITNIDPATAANQMAGMKPGQMRIGDGGFNLAEQNERMAKSLGYAGVDDFNKQKANAPAGGVSIIGEVAPGVTRQDMDNAFGNLGTPGDRAKIAALIGHGNKVEELGIARYGHDVTAQRATGHDNTLRALEQQIKQLELKKQGIISGLFDKANSGDPEALAKYNAMVNGGKEPNYSNRYITLPNRKTYNDMGQITGEEPGGIFDAKTGQLANFGKPDQDGSKAAPAIDVKPGIAVNAPDGTHTFQGKTIVVKNGKVTEVKNG